MTVRMLEIKLLVIIVSVVLGIAGLIAFCFWIYFIYMWMNNIRGDQDVKTRSLYEIMKKYNGVDVFKEPCDASGNKAEYRAKNDDEKSGVVFATPGPRKRSCPRTRLDSSANTEGKTKKSSDCGN